MVCCSLPGCPTGNKRGVSLFRFPYTRQNLWKKWRSYLEHYDFRINLNVISRQRICQFHFEKKFIIKDEKNNKNYLDEDGFPTVYHFKNNQEPEEIATRSSRSLRSSKQFEGEPTVPDEDVKTDFTKKVKMGPVPNIYESTCRLCLQETNDSDVITDEITKKIELLINSPLKTNKIYQNLVCQECSDKVEKFVAFRSQILENQEKFSINMEYAVEVKRELEESDPYKIEIPELVVNDGIIESLLELPNVKYEDLKPATDSDDNDNFMEDRLDFENDIASDDSWKWEENNDHQKKKKRQNNKRYGTMTCEEYRNQKVPCDFCEKEITRLRMKSHVASMHQRSNCSFECDICGARFYDRRGIQSHIEIHNTSKVYKCEQCEETFVTSGKRAYHYRTVHRTMRNLVCHHCAKVYYIQAALDRHILAAHTQVRKFDCDYPGCSTKFYTAMDKKCHIRNTHSGSKKCDECGFVSTSLAALRLHKKKHLGNNYFCNYIVNGVPCGKGFPLEGIYNAHLKTHSNQREFDCPACPAEYKYKRPLITHYLATHSTYRMTCFVEGCSASFVHKDTFKSHIKSSHAYNEEFLQTALQRINKTKIPPLEELIKKYS